MCEKKQQEAAYNWLNERLDEPQGNYLAVTLTFKLWFKPPKSSGAYFVKLDRWKAEQNIRHFINILNQKILGKRFRRFGKRLRVAPVYEINETTRFHAHLVLEKPPGMTLDLFTEIIRSSWIKCDFGYRNIEVTNVRDCGWLVYMLKKRTKDEGVLNAIDFVNCHLADHRLDQNARR